MSIKLYRLSRTFSTSLKITKAREELKIIQEREELYKVHFTICEKRHHTGACVVGIFSGIATFAATLPFGILAFVGIAAGPMMFFVGYDKYIKFRTKMTYYL